MENLQAVSTALVGVALVSSALQGYLIGVGHLGKGRAGMFVRLSIGLSGLTLALPAGGMFGFSQIFLFFLATILMMAGLAGRKILAVPV